MKILCGGSLQLVYALLILLHMQTSIGFNSTIGDDEVRCIESERQALLTFKHGLVDEYGGLSSWGSEEEKKECCKWEGVQCSNTTGHVTGLDLTTWYGFPLRGNLSPSLFELQHLIYLELSGNNFNLSRIPESIGSLNKLQRLDISSCNLSGSLPSQLRNLRGLRHLDLSFNQVQGLIPEYLGHMTYLESLFLTGNQFEGGIPKSFGNLCKLRYLYLSFNNLDGMLPELIGNLSGCLQLSLEELKLGQNKIKGPLPDMIKNFHSLRLLGLYDTQLSGTVPKSIGLLSDLECIYISSDSLNGTINESHFSTLSKLRQLFMSSNSLSINFSNDWIPPFQLDLIVLTSCKLGPEFPSWLKSARKFSYLDISGSGILDSIPEWFWNLSSRVVHVNLSSNHIYGILPDLSTKFSYSLGLVIDLSKNKLEGLLPVFPVNVTSINLSENRLFGSISSLCTITGGKLEFLDVSHNQLSGEFPHCTTQWTRLEILNLANNHLAGEFPHCITQCPKLVILNLANNYFSGKIPSSIGSLYCLQSLGLQNNSFSGEIPWSLGHCSSLQYLDLSHNNLSGKLPTWIGERLSSLIFLLLRSNNFSGNIPLNLCWLTNITLLDLSNNNLFGNIPSCIQNLTELAQNGSSPSDYFLAYLSINGAFFDIRFYVDKASVMWKGMERDYENGNLKTLKIIDLSSNKLTGKIPVQISVLAELVQLNLSRNQLTGWIPSNIGQMRQLESLDLSWNQLSGQLPWSMSQLNFLSILNLSYNNFSGRIPLGTQIQTFDASSFASNPALCGLPLTPTCPEDEKSESKPKNRDKAEFSKSFQPGMELGAAISFVGVLAVKLDHPWKHLCFLLFNNVRVRLCNLKDCLYLIVAVVALLVREHVSRLGRKLKLVEPSVSS